MTSKFNVTGTVSGRVSSKSPSFDLLEKPPKVGDEYKVPGTNIVGNVTHVVHDSVFVEVEAEIK